ncbi:MAG: hypothetical protein KDA25_01355 [Phycisphaerales bacterium]|nr:hypothetical protein [Phycisphaerales bacterium]
MTQSTLAAALVAGLAMYAAGAPSPHVPGDIIIRFVTPPTPTTLADVELLLGGATWHVPPHAPRARSGDAPHPLASFRVATVDTDADLAALIPLI